MSYNNVEVKVTVKVDGQRVGRRKITRSRVATLEQGVSLRDETLSAVSSLANELRSRAGA